MQTALTYIQAELKGLYAEDEIRNIAYLIFESISGRTRSELMINKYTVFSEEEHHKIESFVDKLRKFTPLQYILGETEFFGLNFEVNESVLIPRPETEELLEWIAEENNRKAALDILDIGTGSGCIAITLKHLFPQATVNAFDISEAALQTARNNALRNKLKVEFSQIDILHPSNSAKKWDIMVSNPPYICEKEKVDMHDNVLNFEPHIALFVPDTDPLLFYREIGKFAFVHLNKNGKLYFEINQAYGNETVTLLEKIGFESVELRNDISGNARMVRAILA